MSNIDFADVIHRIGNMNRAELDAVFQAYKTRSKSLRSETALVNQATLTPGTRVVTQNLSPKYLSGLRATVTEGKASRAGDILITVDQDDRYFAMGTGRRRFNLDALAVPAASLRRE